MPASTNHPVPFKTVLDALLDESQPFPPQYLHRLSDITTDDLEQLKNIWLNINANRRETLMEDLEDLADSDTVVMFDPIAAFALSDPDPRVRERALGMLWESQDVKLLPAISGMLVEDPEPAVRAAAASALGAYVYIGELEEMPAEELHKVEEQLLSVTNGSDQTLVRRRALEALGFSSRPEVPGLIQSAYDGNQNDWLASALFAMGRSADTRWEAQVLKNLNNQDSTVQVEAVRAAGNLELSAARIPLLEMLEGYEDMDEDVLAATIWSLSQIGGEAVQGALESLYENIEDEDLVDYLDLALENLEFTNDFALFNLMNVDVDENGENIYEIDLTKDDPDAPNEISGPDSSGEDEKPDKKKRKRH